jgi:hypothetical protein
MPSTPADLWFFNSLTAARFSFSDISESKAVLQETFSLFKISF